MREIDGSEIHRSSLRALVARFDAQMAHLSEQVTTPEAHTTVRELVASLAALVSLLDLGPAPELRNCPVCGRIGMREATRCGYCWTKLAPAGRPKPASTG